MTVPVPMAGCDWSRAWRWGLTTGAALLSVALGGAVLFFPGFAEDDFCWIEDARRAMNDPLHVFTLHISGFLRPVVHASFVANAWLGDLHPGSYYLVNLLLEAGCAVLLARLMMHCGLHPAAAAAGVVGFLVHDTHAEVVGWISARTSSLWTLFALLTLLAWLAWRRTAARRWWAASLFCLAAALLSKEEAVALLPMLAAADRLVTGRRPVARLALELSLHLVLWTAYLLVQAVVQPRNLLVQQGDYGWQAANPANWAFRLIGLFLQARVEGWGQAAAFAAVGAGLGAVAFRGADVHQRRIALFGLVAAALALAPTVLLRGEMPHASRYQYTATVGVALVWAAVLQAAFQRRRGAVATGYVLLSAYLAYVGTQLHDHRDGLRLWREKSAHGAMVLAGVSASADLVAPGPRAPAVIYIVDPPAGVAHLRSAVWLVTGRDPETVFDGLPPSGHGPESRVLRWDAVGQRLRRED